MSLHAGYNLKYKLSLDTDLRVLRPLEAILHAFRPRRDETLMFPSH